MNEKPVPMDATIIDTIESVCKDNGLNYQVMHSGAGHDSQIFAPRVPTGMIFVPSIDGISHNPAEHTEAVDIQQGVQALAEALKRLAY
jgi:allantoate deiminase